MGKRIIKNADSNWANMLTVAVVVIAIFACVSFGDSGSSITVETTGDPVINGERLIDAYGRAKLLTPNGKTLTNENFASVILPPALYDITYITHNDDWICRQLIDNIFNTTFVHIVPQARDGSNTIIKMTENLDTVIPASIDKVCYGVFAQISGMPAVPTFGYYPDLTGLTQKVSSGQYQSFYGKPLLSVPNIWSSYGYCDITDDIEHSSSEPAAKKIIANNAASTSFGVGHVFNSAVDCSDTHWAVKLFIHEGGAGGLNYIQVILIDVTGKCFYVSIWSPWSNQYYKPYGWFPVSFNLEGYTSLDNGFDITSVKQIKVVANKKAGTLPSITINSISAYLVKSEAFTDYLTDPCSGDKIHITSGSGITADWYEVDKKINNNKIKLIDDISVADINDIAADAIGVGLEFGAAWSASTRTLTESGAFGDYIWEEGDSIRITGGMGVTSGWYCVASKDSNDTIVLTKNDMSELNSNDVYGDVIGKPLSVTNAYWDVSEMSLSKTGAFGGCSFQAGDSIYITGGTSGVTAGWYKIDHKENDDRLIMADSIASWDRSGITANAIGHHIYIGAKWNRSQKTLTKTGVFTDYTWKPGDYIRIIGGTLVKTRWIPVASKVNDNTIVTVKGLDLSSAFSEKYDILADAIGTPLDMENGSWSVSSKYLTGQYVDNPQKALFIIDFDDAFKSAEPAVSYCLSKNITPTLYVYGRAIDAGWADHSTVESLHNLQDAGALIANHTYQHWGNMFHGESYSDDHTQLADTLRQNWWLTKNQLGGAGIRILATPAGKWTDDPLWLSLSDNMRYTMFPSSGSYLTTSLDVPYSYIVGGDNISLAYEALTVAIKTKSKCHLLFHKFSPESGGVNLDEFKAYIDYVAKAVQVGAIRVVTPRDLCNSYIGTVMDFGGKRLVELQNNDGCWDCPLDDGNPNSGSDAIMLSKVAIGLVKVYLQTEDQNVKAALQKTGMFLLNKTDNFASGDAQLSLELDQIFGGTTYEDHVRTNFYDKLATGIYYDAITGTPDCNTSDYIQIRRDYYTDSNANMSCWEFGLGLYNANLIGADTSEWITNVKDEINELDANSNYDILGLAGAVLGLAAVHEDFDPTTGEYADANSLRELANMLAGYQLSTGGFSWSSKYMAEGQQNERIRETSFALMALNEFDRQGYWDKIISASSYIKKVQLLDGSWQDYPGSYESNEITGEALWGIGLAVTITGDLESDGRVDFADFAMFAERWLEIDYPGTPGCYVADFNEDGNVDMNDLLELITNWLADTQ